MTTTKWHFFLKQYCNQDFFPLFFRLDLFCCHCFVFDFCGCCISFAVHLLSLSPSQLLMDGCVGNSTTTKQPHSIINICRNVGRRPDRVEAVRLAAENRLPIERLRTYAASLHPEWVTPSEWSKEVNHTGKFWLFRVLSQPVIKPFLTVRWRRRFWLEWRASREAAEQVFFSPFCIWSIIEGCFCGLLTGDDWISARFKSH